MAEKNHGPMRGNARGPRPNVANPGKLLLRLLSYIFKNYGFACIVVVIDLFEKYLSSCEVVAVKTSNMGSPYKLTYHVTLKDNAEEKTFLDELRCRNGNLEISMMRQEANVNEL